MGRALNGNTANFLQVGDAAAIDITGTDITVACWANFDAVTLEQGLVTKWGNTAAAQQYALELLSSKIDFAVHGAAVQLTAGTTVITAGQWYHFCGVQNSTDIFVYLNGVQDGTNANQQSIINTATNLQFGKFQDDGLALTGKIAEIGIWNTPLSASEVAQLATKPTRPLDVQPSRLQGYWPLCGATLPEPDLAKSNTAAQNGTVSAGDHPFFDTVSCFSEALTAPARGRLTQGAAR